MACVCLKTVIQQQKTVQLYGSLRWIMESVKVLNKGQIVIPASIRKKYAIKPGSRIQMFEYGRLIYIIPHTDDPVNGAQGCLPILNSICAENIPCHSRRLPPSISDK